MGERRVRRRARRCSTTATRRARSSASSRWPTPGRRCHRERPAAAPPPPHAADLAAGGDAVPGRHVLLGNDDVTHRVVGPRRPSAAVPQRHRRRARLRAGRSAPSSRRRSARSPRRTGDYVVVPAVDHPPLALADARRLDAARARGGRPRRPSRRSTCTDHGQFLEGAPFSERDLRGPEPSRSSSTARTVAVLVRTRGGLDRATCHAHHPFDVVGWDGCRLPVGASRSTTSSRSSARIHQPPPVHQTFDGPGFVVCSFVPRPVRLRPRRGQGARTTTPTSTPTRCSSTPAGDFMSRSGSGIGAARSPSTRPASSTVPSRAASKPPLEQDAHRRGRGDGRHVPPARPHRPRPLRERPRLPALLGPSLTRRPATTAPGLGSCPATDLR